MESFHIFEEALINLVTVTKFVLEAFSVICIIIGFIKTLQLAVNLNRRRNGTQSFNKIRIKFGMWLALALEFQLGADILATTITPSLTINPLTIPAIITPYGIVAILVATTQSQGNIPRQIAIFGILLVIIILNWLGMTFAKQIIQKLNIITLLIVGWVFAVLQAGLAINLVLEGLTRAKFIFFQ